jgi:hypothetical protein
MITVSIDNAWRVKNTRRKLKNNEEHMTLKEKITESNADQANISKIEKMTNYINGRFDVCADIFKSGGRWSVMLKNHNIEGVKMKEIREYVTSHSEELEEDEDI